MAQQPATDADAEELIEEIVESTASESRELMPRKQIEALVCRDLCGYSRKRTAEMLGISVYTVDDRLRRARTNRDAVVDLVSGLVETGVIDADDLGIEVEVVESEESPEEEPDGEAADSVETEPESKPETDSPSETSDDAPSPWGRIMSLDVVTEITRSSDGSAVSIQTKDSTEDEDELIVEALGELGLGVYNETAFGSTGVGKIRARRPSDPEPEPEPRQIDDELDAAIVESPVEDAPDEDDLLCHYCGDRVEIDDDSPDLIVSWNEDADHPACGGCLSDVAMGGSLDVLPEYRDDPEESTPDPRTVDEDLVPALVDLDEPLDRLPYCCDDWGRCFATGAGLGGHRRYCPEIEREESSDQEVDDVEDDPASADVETLPGIGPQKADDLREHGIETVGDLAEDHPKQIIRSDRSSLGGRMIVKAWDEAQKRLGVGRYSDK